VSDPPDLVPAARFVGVGIGEYDQYPPLPSVPERLLAATELLLCLDLADQVIAEARLHHAIALVRAGHPDEAAEDAAAAARLAPESVPGWLAVLAQLVRADPEVVPLIPALVAPPPPNRRDNPKTEKCDLG
jgi:hypothetical protein